MKKRNRSIASNAVYSTVGDTYDTAVWSLETIAFDHPPVGGSARRFFGTGFLFKREAVIRGRQLVKYFLVSNRHVLFEDSPSILVLHFPQTSNYPGFRYQLYPTQNSYPQEDFLQNVVYAHPTVDLAVIDITAKILELQKTLGYRNFQFSTVNLNNIPSSYDFPKGTPMEYVGFPDRSPYPRLKEGRIGLNPSAVGGSSITLDDVSVAQGASGSPAFITRDDTRVRSKLLGIMYGTQATEMTEGHIEFDQGHAVIATELIYLTNYILKDQGYKPKQIDKFNR